MSSSGFRCSVTSSTCGSPDCLRIRSVARATISLVAKDPLESILLMKEKWSGFLSDFLYSCNPSEVINIAPAPRSASVIRNGCFPGIAKEVGWNCMNSICLVFTEARCAIAIPSPVATDGLVVSLHNLPAPPVARINALEIIECTSPSGSKHQIPEIPSSGEFCFCKIKSTAIHPSKIVTFSSCNLLIRVPSIAAPVRSFT